MFYTFRCPVCLRDEDVQRPVAEAALPGPECCGIPMGRVFNANFNCDEIRSTKYFDPVKRVERVDHGRKFDIGLGKWVSSWSERRKHMKAAGFQEHGIKEV